MNPSSPDPDFRDLLSPQFFKALCDPTRLTILGDVARQDEPATVSRIAGCCAIDLSVVSRHLATLRDAGILKAEKRGKEVHYSLRTDDVVGRLRALADALEGCYRPTPEETPDEHQRPQA